MSRMHSMSLNLLAGLALLALPSLAPAQVVHYYHLDAVGNVRLITDQDRQVVERHDYLPTGEECVTGPCAANPGVGAGQPRKFTGKERDAETGLDYFGARYYGARIARFSTVDPAYVVRENLVDPQRWNKYAYARNNPLKFTDPDGRLIDVIADAGFVAYDLMDIGVTRFTGGEVSGTQKAALAADIAAAAIPFVTGAGIAVRVASRGDHALEAGRAAEHLVGANRARGAASEARVLHDLGEVKNTQKIHGCEGCSIPDYQNATAIGEIKDAARVDNARQIRIQRDAARESGRQHVVHTGTNTRVSKEVERRGTIVRRQDDLGPK